LSAALRLDAFLVFSLQKGYSLGLDADLDLLGAFFFRSRSRRLLLSRDLDLEWESLLDFDREDPLEEGDLLLPLRGLEDLYLLVLLAGDLDLDLRLELELMDPELDRLRFRLPPLSLSLSLESLTSLRKNKNTFFCDAWTGRPD
jgi:hypothetical protein